MKREIDMATDTTGGETTTETGTEIGTGTEAGRGTAATGREATAGSAGGVTEGQTRMALTEEVRPEYSSEHKWSTPAKRHLNVAQCTTWCMILSTL